MEQVPELWCLKLKRADWGNTAGCLPHFSTHPQAPITTCFWPFWGQEAWLGDLSPACRVSYSCEQVQAGGELPLGAQLGAAAMLLEAHRDFPRVVASPALKISLETSGTTHVQPSQAAYWDHALPCTHTQCCL